MFYDIKLIIFILLSTCQICVAGDSDFENATEKTFTNGKEIGYKLNVETLGKQSRLLRKNGTLYIGGIFPMTGGWAGGKGCRPAVDMALEDINSRMDILPGYHLQMIANDSQCEPGLGMNVLYDLLYSPPKKLMLLGPGCSPVATFVGEAARFWNLIVLSYGSSSPALSNRDRFPTFFRTHPSATLHNPCRVKLFKRFGWNRIATIQETQEVWTSTIADLEQRVKEAGIEIAARTSFLTDPENAVSNLKRQDARIIVGLFYENMARRVFCQVYKQKLYGPRYVWFIIGWYPDNWFLEDDPSIDCTPDQMREALEGHFTTEGIMLNPDNDVTVSGLTSQRFIRRLKARIQEKDPLSVTGYVEAPLAYDAVWALAIALNNTQNKLLETNTSLTEYDYSREDMMTVLYSALNTTDFIGVSGRVLFNAAGDRILGSQIEQMKDGNYTVLGYYDLPSDRFYSWQNDEYWPGGKKPQDRTIIVARLRVVNSLIVLAVSVLAAVGILVAAVLLVLNTAYRHNKHISESQPYINNIMLIGCMLCLTSVILQGLDGQYISEHFFGTFCVVRLWVLSLGFTLAYAPMFAKIWTVYRMSADKKDIKNLKRCEMYAVITLLLAVDILVLCIWTLIDPLYREMENFPHEKPLNKDRDIEILPQLEHCACVNIKVWLGVTLGYKGVLLLVGMVLAYETHAVQISQINDSKFVGMSIYNVVVLSLITAPVQLLIGSHRDVSYTFMAGSVLISCYTTMLLCFLPKIVGLLNKGRADNTEISGVTDPLTLREDEEKYQRLLQENAQIKHSIQQKEDQLKQLKKRLENRTIDTNKTQAILHSNHPSNLVTMVTDLWQPSEYHSNQHKLKTNVKHSGEKAFFKTGPRFGRHEKSKKDEQLFVGIPLSVMMPLALPMATANTAQLPSNSKGCTSSDSDSDERETILETSVHRNSSLPRMHCQLSPLLGASQDKSRFTDTTPMNNSVYPNISVPFSTGDYAERSSSTVSNSTVKSSSTC